jgi:hypothetical protein
MPVLCIFLQSLSPRPPSDSFDCTARDADGGAAAGTFTAPYAAYATVETASQWSGYWGGEGNDYQLGTANSDNMSGGNDEFQLGGIAGAVSDGDNQYTDGSGADKYALLLNDNAAGWENDKINSFRILEGDQLVAFNSTDGFWTMRQVLRLSSRPVSSAAFAHRRKCGRSEVGSRDFMLA